MGHFNSDQANDVYRRVAGKVQKSVQKNIVNCILYSIITFDEYLDSVPYYKLVIVEQLCAIQGAWNAALAMTMQNGGSTSYGW